MLNEESRLIHIETLRLVEKQFQLMLSIRLACSLKNQPLYVPDKWSFGKNIIEGYEIQLTNDEADEAAALLEHTITYTLSLHIYRAILDAIYKPRFHKDSNIKSAYQISRLIRNAYSHIPHTPEWSIDSDIQDSHFEVEDIIKLHTSQLHGKAIRWQDYGGLVSLFRLSKWVRLNILNDINNDLAYKRKQYIQSGIMQQGRCIIINEKSPLFISNSKKIEINKLKKVEKDGKQYVVIGKDSDGEYLLEIKSNKVP